MIERTNDAVTNTVTDLADFQERIKEVRDAEMRFKMLAGKFDQDFTGWLTAQGLNGNCHLVDIIAHFQPQTPKLIT